VFPRSFRVVALVLTAFVSVSSAVSGAPAATLRGDVRSRSDGTAVAGASLTLDDATGSPVATTASAADGTFVFARVLPGTYTIDVSAARYASQRIVSIATTRAGFVHVVLTADGAAHAGLPNIVAVSSRGPQPLGAISSLSSSELGATAAGRTSDALARLPGIDLSGDPGSPGGDAFVSLRGLRPSESQSLLDGHPIGPLGIGSSGPDSDGLIEGYDLQDAPYFALRDLQIAFGAGPAGTWGIGSVGGAIDARTLDPTARPAIALNLGGGSQGRQFTSLHATGTVGRFGYAVAYGVEGPYGAFPGYDVAQTGLRGTDFTTATLAALTYPVSGDYVIRNDLAKVSYRPDAATRISFSAYDATSWADKTGEGDNDANPYAYTLFGAPIGIAPGCPAGVLVTTDGGSKCLPPAAYASLASGPAGGGPGAWQAFRNPDYALSIERVSGMQRVAVDAFADDYAFEYHRSASALSGPLDEFDDLWQTTGVRASDVVSSAANVARVGVVWLRQILSGDQTSPDGTALVRDAPAARIDRALTLDDTYALGSRLTFAFAANLATTSLDPTLRVTPRLAIRYDPTARDSFRVAAGAATSEPSLQLDQVELTPPGALNPDCGAIRNATATSPATITAGSAPSRDLAAEKATDLEVGYGRRVGIDSTFGVTVYDSNVRDRIVTASLAAGSALSPLAVAAIENRIGQFCGAIPAASDLQFALTRAFNAGSARARGIELSGRFRATPVLGLDYTYDVQSVALDDLPAAALATDATLVNGAQVFAVPLHKAGLGLELALRSGLDARIDAHYVGVNNPQQLPGYAYADADVSQRVSKTLSFDVTATNVFDSHAAAYGQVGLGIPYPTNAANAALRSPFVQPFDERYGLSPPAFTLGATIRL
jgi:outer membrane cobalamin receptor